MTEPVSSQPLSLQQQELFVSLVARDQPRLLGLILTMVPHRHDAEDLLQKVSLTLWQKFGEFDTNRDFFAWAAKIAFFVICNHRRQLYRQRMTFSQELLEVMCSERESHLAQQGSRLDHLMVCVEHLKSDDRQLLFQMYANELPLKEIALESGKAVQTIYNRVGLLRRQLMQCVERKLAAATI